jgi:hypothetical protein
MIFKEHVITPLNLMNRTDVHLSTWNMENIVELKRSNRRIDQGVPNIIDFHTCSIDCVELIVTLILVMSS